MRLPATLTLTVALSLTAAPQGRAEGDETLAPDPALVTGTLDNGLRYIVAQHANPAGRISVWLHVATGSLNESEKERGLSHFLEHMAFNGSEHFPPGSVVPYFQALGLRFGSDQNAFTNYEQTTYQLALPDAKPETIGKAMLFFSDVAARLTLTGKEIDAERQIILEEKRARGGAATRIRDFVNERLAPESTFGRRAPIGVEEQIRAFTPEDFRAYYTRWYVPAAMTVIAVGDADPKDVVAEIRASFGALAKAPRAPASPAGVKATQGRRAIVASDPEITTCDLSIARVEPPRPPTTTMSQLRSDLVESLAVRVFDRRMSRLSGAGTASFLEGDCSIRDSAAMTTYRVHARAYVAAKAWRQNLTDLGTALQRARIHGFTEREIGDARASMLAESDEAVDRESTAPVRDRLNRINGGVTRGEPVQSAAQRCDARRRLLPGITREEVSAAFAAAFDPANAVFVLEMQSGKDVPAYDEFLKLATAAVDVKPEAEAEAARPASLLAEPPKGGKVAESSEDKASGVSSAWLENGVRVHHRFMADRKDEVTVTITLAAGFVEETAADRGISEAAVLAWKRPAGGALTGDQVRDLLVGRKIHTSASADADTMTLTVSGEPSDLEEGMKLAYLLLTEPVVESHPFSGWHQEQRQAIAARSLNVMGVLAETAADALFPKDDVRMRPLTAAQLRRLTSDAAQTRLRKLASTAPVEVAIVGDLPKDAAMALAVKYLGSLPPRPRIDATTLAPLRKIARPAGPIAVACQAALKTPEATVYAGFFGPDDDDGDEARLLRVAARVLSTRMIASIREERQLVYSIGASYRDRPGFPGWSTFGAQAPTDPAKCDVLGTALEDLYGAFAKDGPTADEMTVAKKQIAVQWKQDTKTPGYWTSVLATLDYRGRTLARALDTGTTYDGFTAAQVKDAFARWYKPENRFRFVICPAPAVPAPAGDGGK